MTGFAIFFVLLLMPVFGLLAFAVMMLAVYDDKNETLYK